MSCEVSQTFCKSENEVLDYKVDWATWLGASTLTSSVWTVPADITKDSDSSSTTDTTIWLSGGTFGDVYMVTNKIETNDSRTAERAFLIQMAIR